jgi:hypothetical protein
MLKSLSETITNGGGYDWSLPKGILPGTYFIIHHVKERGND